MSEQSKSMLSTLKSMRKNKQKSSKTESEVPSGDRERYPYGLRINLDKEEISKLGLGEIEAGSKVNIAAIGKVISVSTNDEETGRTRHSVSIQIQKLGVKPS